MELFLNVVFNLVCGYLSTEMGQNIFIVDCFIVIDSSKEVMEDR